MIEKYILKKNKIKFFITKYKRKIGSYLKTLLPVVVAALLGWSRIKKEQRKSIIEND